MGSGFRISGRLYKPPKGIRLRGPPGAERGVFAESGARSVPKVHQIAAFAMKKQHLRKIVNAAFEIYKVRPAPAPAPRDVALGLLSRQRLKPVPLSSLLLLLCKTSHGQLVSHDSLVVDRLHRAEKLLPWGRFSNPGVLPSCNMTVSDGRE